MHNRFFTLALAQRLLCHVAERGSLCEVVASSSTPCRAQLDPCGWHAHACDRTTIQARHKRWVELWTQAAREAGTSADDEQLASEILAGKEAVAGKEAAKVRSDVRIDSLDAPWPTHIDVRIENTAQRAGMHWKVQKRGKRVANAEQTKTKEWALPSDTRARLVPVTAESQGRWGPKAIALLRSLASRADLEKPGSFAPFMRRWRRRLAVALQLSNCRAVMHACGGGWCTRPPPAEV